jgi:cytosine/adenosine deaminase-related metal-dependent hydrolase
MTPDMLAETRTGYLMHKHHLADNNAGWGEYEQMLLKNNPAIYRRLSGRDVGQIAPGFAADIILVDYFPPTPLNGDNIWGHFLYGLVDAPVDTTIIDGRIVMENKQIPGIDEAAIAARAQESARAVWARFAG